MPKQKLLLKQEDYLTSGLHLGTHKRHSRMKRFIYDVRPDGLALFNLSLLDERIRIAARWIAHHQRVLVVGRKPVAKQALERFAELTGCKAVTERFMPGMLTNPSFPGYSQIDLVLIVDPLLDKQAMSEALRSRIPILAICDSFDDTKYVDLIIPANCRSRRAVATLFWLLAKEVLKAQGKIKKDEEYKASVEEFLAKEG